VQEQDVGGAVGLEQLGARYRGAQLDIVDPRQRTLEGRAAAPVPDHDEARPAVQCQGELRQNLVETLPLPDVSGIENGSFPVAGTCCSRCRRGGEKLCVDAVGEPGVRPVSVAAAKVFLEAA